MRDIEEKAEIYKALRDTVNRMESGGLIYIGKQGEGYTDLRVLLPDEMVEWIRRDIIRHMNMETIAIRQEIRLMLDEDEAEQLGIEIESAAEVPPEEIGIPKNDHRRCGSEVDDGK